MLHVAPMHILEHITAAEKRDAKQLKCALHTSFFSQKKVHSRLWYLVKMKDIQLKIIKKICGRLFDVGIFHIKSLCVQEEKYTCAHTSPCLAMKETSS